MEKAYKIIYNEDPFGYTFYGNTSVFLMFENGGYNVKLLMELDIIDDGYQENEESSEGIII